MGLTVVELRVIRVIDALDSSAIGDALVFF